MSLAHSKNLNFFLMSSLTCRSNLAKTFCGSSPNHLPHKIEKKTLGSQTIYLTFAQSFNLGTYVVEPLEGEIFLILCWEWKLLSRVVSKVSDFFMKGPIKRSSLQKTWKKGILDTLLCRLYLYKLVKRNPWVFILENGTSILKNPNYVLGAFMN